ncbi:hypothetical protein N7G274_003978 [Stereocaulon virgatum]|uniref:Uncharacterized protein n=1 Tax=Stereocaulon virgatum TaxID=373712 RepID=A0ABR4AAX3_9LECA
MGARLECGEEVQVYRGVSGYSMVLCGGISIVFLHGLFDVTMASILYTTRDSCPTSYDQLLNRLYHILGALFVRRFGGSAYAPSCLGLYCYYSHNDLPRNAAQD